MCSLGAAKSRRGGSHTIFRLGEFLPKKGDGPTPFSGLAHFSLRAKEHKFDRIRSLARTITRYKLILEQEVLN